MTRFLIAITVFAALATGVGFLLSGEDDFAWGVALGLFGLALLGEALRLWLRRKRQTPADTEPPARQSARF
ncbi:hypothetical protein [Kribbella monticola]|uniref:hypothetical protein n=1 Tax=Kribbella monticola TaxID=2185285 RepID=UPI000DD2E98C|nr:hypothetical protein [Kribbella monticola]